MRLTLSLALLQTVSSSITASLQEQEEQEEAPIYEDVPDEIEELSQILTNSNDLSKEVEFSRDENPIYDMVAASETETLLRSSQVTYPTLSASFKKEMKKKGKKPNILKRMSSALEDLSVGRKQPVSKRLSASSENVNVGRKPLSKQVSSPVLTGGGKQRPPSPHSPQMKHAAKRAPILPPKRLSTSSEPRSTSPTSPGITKLGVVADSNYDSEVYGASNEVRSVPPSVTYRKPSSPWSAGITKMEVTREDTGYDDAQIYDDVSDLGFSPPTIAIQTPGQPRITKLGVSTEVDNERDEIYDDVSTLRNAPPPLSQKKGPIDKKNSNPGSIITRIASVGSMDTGGEIYTNPEEMMMSQSPASRLQSDSMMDESEELYQCPTEDLEESKRVRGVHGIGEVAKPQRLDPRPPKPPRNRQRRKSSEVEEGDTKPPPRTKKPGEALKVRKEVIVVSDTNLSVKYMYPMINAAARYALVWIGSESFRVGNL